jgi:hypothetical protein
MYAGNYTRTFADTTSFPKQWSHTFEECSGNGTRTFVEATPLPELWSHTFRNLVRIRPEYL